MNSINVAGAGEGREKAYNVNRREKKIPPGPFLYNNIVRISSNNRRKRGRMYGAKIRKSTEDAAKAKTTMVYAIHSANLPARSSPYRLFGRSRSGKRSARKLCRVCTNEISETAREYAQNSSLHGLRYVGNKELHFVERLFWILSFCIATYLSFYFIRDLLQKWYEKPVIMSLSPKSTSLTAIPFPAITICNMNNVRKSIAEDILKSDTTPLERWLLKDFCDEDSILGNTVDDNVTSSWKMVQSFMIKVSQPCDQMILSCKWHGEHQNCYEIFNAALTDEGLCCSFNKIKSELIFRNAGHASDPNTTFPFTSIDWTPEKGYDEGTPLNHIPWRPWGAGSHLGLTVVLNAELDEYYCSSEASHGFKILLHSPIETPKISAFGTLVCPGTETQIIIKPTIDIATFHLRKINQQNRQCFFSDERQLRFYRTYTQRNCILECEANFTLHYCQCVIYYMPSSRFEVEFFDALIILEDVSTRICGKKDTACANRAKLAMETKLRDRWSTNDTDGLFKSQKPNCGCLPACFQISYSKIQSTSDLSTLNKVKQEYILGRDPRYFRKNMAVVHFFFTEAQFTSIVKGELFGTTELLCKYDAEARNDRPNLLERAIDIVLAGAGGLLGLFMGFSFLSVFEALYFVTLRLWCSIKKKREETKIQQKPYVINKSQFPFLN